MDLNEPQLFPLPVITPISAGAKFIQAVLSPLEPLSSIFLRYLCGHVLQLLGKTGALRLQPQSLLLLTFCHPAPKQKAFILPGQTLPLYHRAEERRRQASLKPWQNDCNTSSVCLPLFPPVPGLGTPTGTEQEWWQELAGGTSWSYLSLVHCTKRGDPQDRLALRGNPQTARHAGVIGCGEDFSPFLHLLHIFLLYRSLYPFELQKYSKVPLEFTGPLFTQLHGLIAIHCVSWCCPSRSFLELNEPDT